MGLTIVLNKTVFFKKSLCNTHLSHFFYFGHFVNHNKNRPNFYNMAFKGFILTSFKIIILIIWPVYTAEVLSKNKCCLVQCFECLACSA